MRRSFKRAVWALAAGLLGCSGASADPSAAMHLPCTACAIAGGASGSSELEAGAAGAAGETAPASDVAISEVSFWQTVRVPLAIDGNAVPGNAPIVQNKEGMLRVYVTPSAGFLARELNVSLELAAGDGPMLFESKKLIRASSQAGEFASTFNFPLDASFVRADASYAVTLREDRTGRVLGRYPANDRSALGAQSSGSSLQVVVVPIVVNGIAPDVSASRLASFRARVLAMYPVSALALGTHAPLNTAIAVSANKGWDELLDALLALRAADAPPANVYYYGLLTPTTGFTDYCLTDCTVGLSVVTDAGDIEDRGSIGLDVFSDGSNGDAPDTMAHELGHALGRDHAPCDVSLKDSGPFPYKGGKIGVWGFDSLNHLLQDPQLYGDVMGYCTPDWISDFTYRGLFDRIQQVNATVLQPSAKSLLPPALSYRRVLLRASGELAWGSRGTRQSDAVQSKRLMPVTLVAQGSQPLAQISVEFLAFADRPGGFLLIPESALGAAAGVARIRVGAAELAVPTF